VEAGTGSRRQGHNRYRADIEVTMGPRGWSVTADTDGVLVISVWKQGPEGFLGRLTATEGPEERSETVVTSPDDLLAAVRDWLASLS
jgi:hypothetical protein